jgi:hypothetical protein
MHEHDLTSPAEVIDEQEQSVRVYKPYPACPVCLCEHDDEIHAATLSVRARFRAEVVKNFDLAILRPLDKSGPA